MGKQQDGFQACLFKMAGLYTASHIQHIQHVYGAYGACMCIWRKLLYLPFKTKDGDLKNKLVSCIEMIINASLDITKLLEK